MLYEGAPCENFPTSANLNGAASTSVSASENSNVGPLSPAKIVPIAGGGESAKKYLWGAVFAVFPRPEMVPQLQRTFSSEGSASESREAAAEAGRLTELTRSTRSKGGELTESTQSTLTVDRQWLPEEATPALLRWLKQSG
ncbi:UNVERIFIED_CONTAM: hypothetical protein Sindi_1770400, partial [Sesamum indicum]